MKTYVKPGLSREDNKAAPWKLARAAATAAALSIPGESALKPTNGAREQPGITAGAVNERNLRDIPATRRDVHN